VKLLYQNQILQYIARNYLLPLIRLVESGNAVGKEKDTVSLQSLSMLEDTSRVIIKHGVVRLLIELCHNLQRLVLFLGFSFLFSLCVSLGAQQASASVGRIHLLINTLERKQCKKTCNSSNCKLNGFVSKSEIS
jgi:hypothetical protein